MIFRRQKGRLQAVAGACAVALCLAVTPVRAQDGAPGAAQDLLPAQGAAQDLLPAQGAATQTAAPAPAIMGEPTHPALQMTPDKSEIIILDRPAKSLVVGNPIHLNVLMDSATRLILVPREPGATFFTVLDEEGKLVMQRHVLVAAPAEKYIRVRRSCNLAGEGCNTTSVYYCPDTCHPIGIMGQEQDSGAGAAAGAAPAQGAPGAVGSAPIPPGAMPGGPTGGAGVPNGSSGE